MDIIEIDGSQGEGGGQILRTSLSLAACYDFIKHAFLPVLKQMGVESSVSIERYGFYPVGAGKWTIKITPPQQYSKIKIED